MRASMEPFGRSRLKIERAKHHVSELHSRISAFQVADFYTISVERNPETGEDVVRYRENKQLPAPELALVVGDALHNLKSALDIAVNEVVLARLGVSDRYCRFPVRETREELQNAIQGGLIGKASKAVNNFLVDTVKAYKGGNDALWALHELNILDKHRLLIQVLKLSTVHGIVLQDDAGVEVPVTWVFTEPVETSSARFPGSANVRVADRGKPTISVYFDHGMPMEGQLVVPALVRLTRTASEVLDGLEGVFSTGS